MVAIEVVRNLEQEGTDAHRPKPGGVPLRQIIGQNINTSSSLNRPKCSYIVLLPSASKPPKPQELRIV